MGHENEEMGDNEAAEMNRVMGFGTFGRPSKPEPAKVEKTKPLTSAAAVASRNQHKTARKFDIEEIMKEHYERIEEKAVTFVKSNSDDGDDDNADDDDDEIVAPNQKANISKTQIKDSENDTDDDEMIGPPLPPGFQPDQDSKDDEKNEDDDADYDIDDDNRYRVLPISHEIELKHGPKCVSALALDPNGARLVTGGIDYELKYWDFQGMDNTLQSFRTITPCQSHSIKHLEFSSNGELILVISGASVAKLVDRDGFVKSETIKGDQYISDMSNTKGHIAMLNYGCWHPLERHQFATCSNDGTCRLWDTETLKKQHRALIKPRSQVGLRTQPNVVAFTSMGDLIALGCNDGSVQMWDTRKSYVNVTHQLREAHAKSTDVSSIMFSYNGSLLASRGTDSTLKLWDMRMVRQTRAFGKQASQPLHAWTDLFNRFSNTDCFFSPDDRLVGTGLSCDERRDSTESGRLHFYDCSTFELVQEVTGGERASIIRSIWHPKLNQIVTSSSDGSARMLYDLTRSSRGALLCSFRQKRKRKDVFQMSQPTIITPHALPLFKQERRKSKYVQQIKDRKDPVKSHRPDLPLSGAGAGGRLAAAGKTFASFIAQQLGVKHKIDDNEDPREAILKFDKDAKENPYWVTPAYQQTQPKAIFSQTAPPEPGEDDEEEIGEDGQRKKRKHIPV